MPPKIPTRTDAYVACACGGTMGIVTVEPIPGRPDFMRHTYHCRDCGKDATFDVAKKGVAAKTATKTASKTASKTVTKSAAKTAAAKKTRR